MRSFKTPSWVFSVANGAIAAIDGKISGRAAVNCRQLFGRAVAISVAIASALDDARSAAYGARSTYHGPGVGIAAASKREK